MAKSVNIRLGLILAVLVGLAAFQGRLLSTERDAQEFFRWILAAAEAKGRDGFIVPADVMQDIPDLADESLFAQVVEKIDPELPEISGAGASPIGDQTGSQSRLVASLRTRQAADPIDPTIWRMARGPELADARALFNQYRAESKLFSAGTALTVGSLYGDEGVTASLGNIFFGFRKMAANLLWLQVDTYFHSGENHLLLPTLRTVVALDPQFVEAYRIGAWHMSFNITAKMDPTPEAAKVYSRRFDAYVGTRETYIYEGIDLLKLGIKNNSRNYALYFDLGFMIYSEKLMDYENAAKYLKEAVRYRHEPFVARTYYRTLLQNEQYAESKEGWEYYLANYDADHEPSRRFSRYCDALLAHQKGDQALERYDAAVAAGDTAASEAAKAELMAAYDESRAIWADIVATFGDDPFGESRILLMDAREDILEGRYYEAIGRLGQARSRVPLEYALPLNDMLIEVKQLADVPLNFSERMQVQRDKERDLAIAAREQEEVARETGAPVAGSRRIQWPLLILSFVFMGVAAAAVVVMARSKA